jgi:glycosyltransferase involved in cell wall biosynthesis
MMDPWFREQYPIKHVFKQVFWSLAEGRVLRDAKMVLFTSEEEKLRARNVFHGHAYREQVVLYGAANPEGDAAAEKAAFFIAFPALQHRRFLLFLSRIHRKKGCDLLIRAFAQCADQLSSRLQLVIAGPDQVGWMRELKALAARLGVAERVHWTGMLEGELKWGAFRSAEAFVLPSHQENFGVVVAEAMACGTPVLISNKVNIWREVVASHGGFAAPDTVEGTEDLLRRFQSLSEEERTQMKRDARQGFVQRFEIRAAVHDLLRVIESASDQKTCFAQSVPELK